MADLPAKTVKQLHGLEHGFLFYLRITQGAIHHLDECPFHDSIYL